MKSGKRERIRFISITLAAFLVLTITSGISARIEAAGTVDFAIESVSLSPAQCYENTRPSLVIKVKNVGPDPIDGAQILVNLSNRRTDGSSGQTTQFSGVSFSKPYSNPRIAAGEVVSLQANLYNATYLPGGSYEVKATLTMGGSAYGKETNLANNTFTLNYTIIAGREPGTNGDLAITGYRFNDKGSYHELVVDTANLGTDTLRCNFNVELTAKITSGARQAFSAKQVIYPYSGSFAPGTTRQLVFQVRDADTNQRLADGTYQLYLSAWASANSCPEISTANNQKQEAFTLSTSPVRIEPNLKQPGVKTKVPINPITPVIPNLPSNIRAQ